MTNEEKFKKVFAETFGVSAYSVFELECICIGRCAHHDDSDFKCIQCEYDARNFWKQEYKERNKE